MESTSLSQRLLLLGAIGLSVGSGCDGRRIGEEQTTLPCQENLQEKANRCVIDGSCYAAGDRDLDGCGVCDPARSYTQWTRSASCPSWAVGLFSGLSTAVRAVATDAIGNIYAAGQFGGTLTLGRLSITSVGLMDVFVAKLSASGLPQWLTRAGGHKSDHAYGIDVDLAGDVYVVGAYEEAADFGTLSVATTGGRDIFVAKLAQDGKFRWVRTAAGSDSAAAMAVSVDEAGSAVITGNFSGSATFGEFAVASRGAKDVFVAKLTPQGRFVWVTTTGGTADDVGTAVAIDRSGEVYATGSFGRTDSPLGRDVFVAKMTTGGDVIWWTTDLSGDGACSGSAIDVDAGGAAYVGGSFSSTRTFGASTITSKGNSDLFVAKVSPQGDFVWGLGAGGRGSDATHALAVDEDGTVYATGQFFETITLGSTTLTAKAAYDILVFGVDPNGNAVTARSGGGDLTDIGYAIAIDRDHLIVGGLSSGDATFGTTRISTGDKATSGLLWKMPSP